MRLEKKINNDKVKVVTFGCRLNHYESNVMKRNAELANQRNIIIINTCAVTNEAERQCKQEIRKLRKLNPKSKIYATGCAVQLNPEKYIKMDEIDNVIGNEYKTKNNMFAKLKHKKSLVTDIMKTVSTNKIIAVNNAYKVRANLEIQQGCDHRCTFCIIPFARGNNRSTPIGELVRCTRELLMFGIKEITLTGVDICSYGSDLPGKPRLGQMIRRLLKLVPELPRLRLSSLDPAQVDDELIDVINNEERLLPYFHLSVQSGDNMILKRMKRRHSREDTIQLAKIIKSARPESILGCDIIAGFPTETENNFQNTLKLIDEANLTKLHVFPFSPKEGTPANKMPQVKPDLVKHRASEIRKKGNRNFKNIMNGQLGKNVKVLVERKNKGYTENYLPVKLTSSAKEGELINAVISDKTDRFLIAS